ncbi:peptide chain release factor N(5)-glutamine methyltransferase [Clostridium sp. AWRP]|uniref:peptide chain release factor N(5)-glutamine methyltransferase n=1 Tax=Clostridium sp. AWRP TaxID=2212991 RepID=UPI000FD86590|nr:peptide chain release factor N(5)-glutamine methyltransferase [Clostridium sp. AWRP]AZV55297.1 peptide chain release factor N(5)-glutamine methyltransferase [Clostridium sp. AWRP]
MKSRGSSIRELLTKGYEVLKNREIESYALDAQLLLGKVLNKDRLFMLINGDYEVAEKETEEYYKYLKLRENKMPVKYILGHCEFMSIDFIVKPGVLIPRPDTETLVEQALIQVERNNFHNICDVCCGTGIIGISIAKLIEDINVKCCDISSTACEVTAENIRRLSLEEKVQVVKSNLMEYYIQNEVKFHMIVSNPPYIKESSIPILMEDVKNYEPREALSGGKDGLEFYREITKESLKVLESSGIIMFEIGYDQRKSVSDILAQNGFKNIMCIKDLAGKDRVIKGVL